MAQQAEEREPAEGISDGRVRRGARNREDIVEALLALVAEGELSPTAEQVARRAGVGTRTVFRHFDDMEQLRREITAHVLREAAPLIQGTIAGNRDERLNVLVRRRAALFEKIAPMRRAGDLKRPFSDVLKADLVETNQFLRAQIVETFPEELGDDDRALEQLDAVTSYESWSRLREHQGLGRERARQLTHDLAALILERAARDRG